MDQQDLVEHFGAAIENNRASLLVGAGLSCGASYPDWTDLISPVAKKFGVPPLDDLALRAEYIENEPDGKDALAAHVADKIGSVEPIPLDNHKLIAQLPVRDVWTTNYDTLLETAAPEYTVIECDEDLVNAQAGHKRIIKMHGSIRYSLREPVGGCQNLVLSRSDYESYENTHPRLWRLLQAQFLTSSFLFLGFSLTDPNFEAVFRVARLTTRDNPMTHYALLERPTNDDRLFKFRCSDLRKAGVEVVEFGDYDVVTETLRQLIARTRPARVFVSGSTRDPDDTPAHGSDPYPTAESQASLDAFAEQLGTRLAEDDIPGLAAAGVVGATVGYAFLEALPDYQPERFVLIRRQSRGELGPPNRRQGHIHFDGNDPGKLRDSVFDQVRAVVIMAGGPGTRAEADEARRREMSVVPIAHTGGEARNIWEEMNENLRDHFIGHRSINPDTFAKLASDDADTALDAASVLIRRGLFLN